MNLLYAVLIYNNKINYKTLKIIYNNINFLYIYYNKLYILT